MHQHISITQVIQEGIAAAATLVGPWAVRAGNVCGRREGKGSAGQGEIAPLCKLQGQAAMLLC